MSISSHERDWHCCNVATDSLLVTVWILPPSIAPSGADFRPSSDAERGKKEEKSLQGYRICRLLVSETSPPLGASRDLATLALYSHQFEP